MEYVIGEWDKMAILQKVMEHKLVYLETKDVVETTLALDNFKRACDCGRGAVFLSVARGKVAEGIDFDRHYGRCVVLFGIPYQYTLSHVLRARLNFMREKYSIRDNDFLTFDAVRQAAQCMGRVIRSKTDYGVVVLADSRYNRQDKRSKLPPWIVQFIRESSLNLSTDVAVDQIRAFLKVAGQPIDQQALQAILFDQQQVGELAKQFAHHAAAAPVLPALPVPSKAVEAGPGASVVDEELLLEELYQREMLQATAGEEAGPMEVEDAGEVTWQPVQQYPSSLFLFEDILDDVDDEK
mmetsp:Transcript_3447/g.4931  ORF Transcript_3447/g.4931 Transcript_3447/m.4931 type:complete len:296 (+) Transcript_3447:160-1047(+)